MDNLCAWISLISGCYFIFFALIANTENFASALMFKVFPFFFGIGNVYVALKLFDVIIFK